MKNKIEFVESTTVNQLLSDHQMTRLDFISLDVEGTECDVLKGIDFNRVDVTAILIECHRYSFMDIIEKMYENNFILAEAMTRFNKLDYPN